MYQVGDKVIYSVHGVCMVSDLEQRTVDGKKQVYLALEPVGQTGSKYLVPTHNEAAMKKLRRMLTTEELEELMRSEAVKADGWIQDENLRKQTYRELIASCDRARLMQMVRTLYRHKAAQTAAGRKCHLCDENFLRDAEKLLMGEIAMVLELDMDQARKYIRERLKEDA